MSTTKLVIIGLVAALGVVGLATVQRNARLREQTQSLQRELAKLASFADDSQRLSNLLAQAKVAQSSANDQMREVLRLRGELSQLAQEKEDSNRVEQVKAIQDIREQLSELTGLRSEVAALGDEISGLRDALEEAYAADALPPAAASRASETPPEPTSPEPIPPNEPREEMGIRMINTHGEEFADKLKVSVAAQEGETFQEVFGRFLEMRGVDLDAVATLLYDERTGRVIVRAARPALDQIERLTVALDASE